MRACACSGFARAASCSKGERGWGRSCLSGARDERERDRTYKIGPVARFARSSARRAGRRFTPPPRIRLTLTHWRWNPSKVACEWKEGHIYTHTPCASLWCGVGAARYRWSPRPGWLQRLEIVACRDGGVCVCPCPRVSDGRGGGAIRAPRCRRGVSVPRSLRAPRSRRRGGRRNWLEVVPRRGATLRARSWQTVSDLDALERDGQGRESEGWGGGEGKSSGGRTRRSPSVLLQHQRRLDGLEPASFSAPPAARRRHKRGEEEGGTRRRRPPWRVAFCCVLANEGRRRLQSGSAGRPGHPPPARRHPLRRARCSAPPPHPQQQTGEQSLPEQKGLAPAACLAWRGRPGGGGLTASPAHIRLARSGLWDCEQLGGGCKNATEKERGGVAKEGRQEDGKIQRAAWV